MGRWCAFYTVVLLLWGTWLGLQRGSRAHSEFSSPGSGEAEKNVYRRPTLPSPKAVLLIGCVLVGVSSFIFPFRQVVADLLHDPFGPGIEVLGLGGGGIILLGYVAAGIVQRMTADPQYNLVRTPGQATGQTRATRRRGQQPGVAAMGAPRGRSWRTDRSAPPAGRRGRQRSLTRPSARRVTPSSAPSAAPIRVP